MEEYIPVGMCDCSVNGSIVFIHDQKMEIAALLCRAFSDVFFITDIYYQIVTKSVMSESFEVTTITRKLWRYSISVDVLAVLPLTQSYPPQDPPNPDVFNFGIFTDAIQLRILGPVDFPKKFFHSYWWGLQNLSSFGQNLKTSPYVWEVCFACLITVMGLLLFTYLIGNIQTYMQMAVKRSEEIRKSMRKSMRIKDEEFKIIFGDKLPPKLKIVLMGSIQNANENHENIDWQNVLASFKGPTGPFTKEEIGFMCRKSVSPGFGNEKEIQKLSADLWLHNNNIPSDLKTIIRLYVEWNLEYSKDVNLQTVLSVLPLKHKESLKIYFCLATLKKVPILRNMGVKVLEGFICYLKPVVYSEHSYIIRKGEPLDLMLFITQGVVWSYAAKNDNDGSNYGFTSFKRLERGDYYGEELLKETLTSPDLVSSFPISSLNVKSHTKVEAFVLTANDLMAFKSKHDWLFTNKHSIDLAETKWEWASHAIQNVWRRHVTDHNAQTRLLLH
ncbi:hypothetical protein FEM48_Zijuj03G0172400 [Ziziphus jujuba var. spinosa]|uniref:Cyclic nucleotide-binding domain-containing protein n=1 Tax=Ziziphus jujuba var. spinosa TaxID=714518 RepID=A0A978VRL3_ZIZJJ|nr:hypothetical protein FEM48_Zijuj03G0172400 [Ziziphus jujuba var. spinosa]